MNGSLKVVQAIVLLSFVGLFFTSCGGSQTTLASTTTSGTTTPGGNTGLTSGTPTVEEEEENATIPAGYTASNLFVTVPDSITYQNYSSLNSGWANRCTFTSSSLINDLSCVVQVNELAVFREGMKFQYNVPANACKYIATYPYWYWNHEVGDGPKDVQVTVTKDASGTVTVQNCAVDGSGSFNCSSATPPIAANDVVFDIAEDIGVKCAYDKSDEEGGVNCCFGKYRLRTTVNTPDGTTSTDERGKSWGGSVEACMGGPGKTSWEEKNSAGYPRYVIEKMEPGVARTKIVRIDATIDKTPSSDSTVHIANYFTMGAHTHRGFGTASSTLITSQFPYFIDPISDRSGDRIGTVSSTLSAGSPYYIFDCLDEAFEVNYRFRGIVQEWDTVAAMTSFITTGVSGTPVTQVGNDSGTADEPGTAPDECPGLTGEACNQLTDIDDFLLRNPRGEIPWMSFSNTFPASRTFYFPKHAYE